jgi:hypothetical protein
MFSWASLPRVFSVNAGLLWSLVKKTKPENFFEPKLFFFLARGKSTAEVMLLLSLFYFLRSTHTE